VLDVVPVVVVDTVPVLEVEANFEYVVPAVTCRDRNGSKVIVVETLSVVVGPDCPITKPWEWLYPNVALITLSANLYAYVKEPLA